MGRKSDALGRLEDNVNQIKVATEEQLNKIETEVKELKDDIQDRFNGIESTIFSRLSAIESRFSAMESRFSAMEAMLVRLTDRQTKSTASAVSAPPEVIEIFVKSLTGKTFSLKVKMSDSVDKLKARIEEDAEGIPVDVQRLIFDGKVLEDGRILSEVNIQNGDIVHLFLL